MNRKIELAAIALMIAAWMPLTICVLARPYAWGHAELLWLAGTVAVFGWIGYGEWTTRRRQT